MGMVYQCDVCRKIVKTGTCVELTKSGVDKNDAIYIGKTYYLCNDCTEKLKKWLNGGGKLYE